MQKCTHTPHKISEKRLTWCREGDGYVTFLAWLQGWADHLLRGRLQLPAGRRASEAHLAPFAQGRLENGYSLRIITELLFKSSCMNKMSET